jgi:hypothetical protein
VIESLVVSDKPLLGSPELLDANLDQASVLEALLLYHDRLVKYLPGWIKEGEFAHVDKHTKFASEWDAPVWRDFVDLHHRFPLEIRNEDKDPFRSFWEKLRRSEKQERYLNIALGKFIMASDMAADAAKILYRLVDYVSSMEALLTTDEPEVSFKLPMRMATLLGRTPKESQDVFDFMRRTYRVRSKLVHGEKLNGVLPLTVRKVEIPLDEALGRFHSYSRDCIRSTVELIEAGFSNKRELLRLLDLARLRTDLLESMEAFIDGQREGKKLREDFDKVNSESFIPRLHDERDGVLR